MKHIVALSGGKDSTAMALRLAEVEPRDYTYICTPTGNESADMLEHWARLGDILGKPVYGLVRILKDPKTMTDGPILTLDVLIEMFNALPNNRQRWCTRMLKIEPMVAFLKANQPAIQYVGLRADEELREGLYSSEIVSDYPFRRWGWGLREVWTYLDSKGVRIPERTDCLKCYDQRLFQWRNFRRNYPELWTTAENQEEKTGATFRSPSRDSYPAALKDLAKEFDRRPLRGDVKRLQGSLITADCDTEQTACRVCRL